MPIKVVASQSDAELEAVKRAQETERALSNVRYALRDLTANLLRVTRGHGHPWRLGKQMVVCIEAFEAYRKVADCYPSTWEIQQALDYEAAWAEIRPRSRPQDEVLGDPYEDHRFGQRVMADGALQMVASMLLHQIPQEAAGKREMSDGMRMVESARSAITKNMLAGQRKTKPPKAKRLPEPPRGHL